MKIRILRRAATETEIRDMLETLQTYIKLAVDVERGVLAGGGEYHADCEEVLLEDGRLGRAIVGWRSRIRRSGEESRQSCAV